MWLRKCGVPALWPSRIKVLITGILLCLFIFNFVMYMWQADVTYLNLQKPKQDPIVCRMPLEECWNVSSPVECIQNRHVWVGQAIDLSDVLPNECHGVSMDQCSTVRLPISAISGDLARLWTVGRIFNPLQTWAILFLTLMLILCVALLVHDLALLQEECRPHILSLKAATRSAPKLWACIKRAHCRKLFSRLRKTHWACWLICFPFMMIWQAVLFMTLAYPMILLFSLFIIGPIRMARILVFLSSAFTCLWGVVFLIELLAAEADEYFAVLWTSDAIATLGCICFCEYRLQLVVVERLTFSCVFVILGSFSVFFRALKGLRRPQWAGLFSVLYSVPINVYPVQWTRPEDAGGGPIYRREVGEPVQGEPAFDPFCLMDEQPESAKTRVVLFPTTVEKAESLEVARDDVAMLDVDSEADKVEIGCCGFPMRRKDHRDRVPQDDPGRKGGVHIEPIMEEPEKEREADLESAPQDSNGSCSDDIVVEIPEAAKEQRSCGVNTDVDMVIAAARLDRVMGTHHVHGKVGAAATDDDNRVVGQALDLDNGSLEPRAGTGGSSSDYYWSEEQDSSAAATAAVPSWCGKAFTANASTAPSAVEAGFCPLGLPKVHEDNDHMTTPRFQDKQRFRRYPSPSNSDLSSSFMSGRSALRPQRPMPRPVISTPAQPLTRRSPPPRMQPTCENALPYFMATCVSEPLQALCKNPEAGRSYAPQGAVLHSQHCGRGGSPPRGSPPRGSPQRGSPPRGSSLRGSPLRGSSPGGSPLRGSPPRGAPLRGSPRPPSVATAAGA
mmetsp:Transcript_18998/g.44332  ORF Transcript_18998/g.44332 Transcript_18998/m.44332 type:complete len:785 (+) Transcript_18998:63-2417(+)